MTSFISSLMRMRREEAVGSSSRKMALQKRLKARFIKDASFTIVGQ